MAIFKSIGITISILTFILLTIIIIYLSYILAIGLLIFLLGYSIHYFIKIHDK